MEIEKLLTTTLTSSPITHFRLKQLSEMAQCTEDHISRLALGISIRNGIVGADWMPDSDVFINDETGDFNEKQIRGSTLFKGEVELWTALVLTHQSPSDYSNLREVFISHWERGVEELYTISKEEDDWLRVLNRCME